MAFKFPFTNYHELNLTWVLEQLKKLFEESEENVETIETYDNRLSAVETEVTDLESTTTQAINTANAAATNAATALSRANTANENALTAGSQAGAAVTAAQGALQEAQAATQAAQQAQATAMTFDGRITQAQNDASAAVQEAQSFENRVNAAINTANNAANTATIAQGIAVNANQTAAQALDELNAQRAELVEISEEQQEAIEEIGQQVIASIPSDYTQLSADVKNKAPLIVANASGDNLIIKDGADNMAIRKLLATINPIQAGTGEPSTSNVRPISGRTSLNLNRLGLNQFPKNTVNESKTVNGVTVTAEDGVYKITGTSTAPGDITFDLINSVDLNPAKNKILFFNNPASSFYTQLRREETTVHYWVMSPANRIGENWSDTGNEVVNKIAFRFEEAGLTSNTTISPVLTLKENNIDSFVPFTGPYSGDIKFNISWATEAGTIYGGELDIITGKLKVDKILYVFDGYESQFVQQSGRVAVQMRGTPQAAIAPAFCSDFSNVQTAASRYAYIPTTLTAEELQLYMRNNNVQMVYQTISPMYYDLTPVAINSILGYNNIFTDCGPVSVDYPADTKLYIDGKFAELQALVLEH